MSLRAGQRQRISEPCILVGEVEDILGGTLQRIVKFTDSMVPVGVPGCGLVPLNQCIAESLDPMNSANCSCSGVSKSLGQFLPGTLERCSRSSCGLVKKRLRLGVASRSPERCRQLREIRSVLIDTCSDILGAGSGGTASVSGLAVTGDAFASSADSVSGAPPVAGLP